MYADSYNPRYRDSGSSGYGFLVFFGMAYRDLNRKHFVEGFSAKN